ncbi:hypothetical protein OESDEN_09127 [Oesophagostomum dentatum]|uniref:Uncharacterized protein n=1 Tax=Oesophagostomum dentatum TaxID=61180 RepID=A0A0B1T0D5_OESDE|nr:hypothetical protein OESDEN_09127 [Oesophagostomum dentatum]
MSIFVIVGWMCICFYGCSEMEFSLHLIQVCSDFYVYLYDVLMASAVKGKILAVIGDEDTVVGFLLGGVGELNKVT